MKFAYSCAECGGQVVKTAVFKEPMRSLGTWTCGSRCGGRKVKVRREKVRSKKEEGSESENVEG
jgi:hypothetical protein